MQWNLYDFFPLLPVVMNTAEKVILNPQYHTLLSIVKSFRNGLMYVSRKIVRVHVLLVTLTTGMCI